MKRTFLLSLFVSYCLSSCIFPMEGDDDFNPQPQNYEAQIMSRDIFESSVQLLPPQGMEKSGKIYIQDDLMVVNDINRGFHFYDYSNPAQPVEIAFLNIPGATDIAIRNSTIYINQAVDLVTLEYNQVTNTIAFKDRDRNVFPQKISPDASQANPTANQIIINWIPIN
ncbi:hypothetical protein [Flavobacterium silvaticum]|uniref:Uncharacterized protein n=1 Tax=Flavobacterium silvaticum TaxID=1852020 RepID=A0A972FL82_9FLAO|nr:hypothetical protein [Flavobacterium silvaticum]NMH27783.1 hypothetical protein [Flavobacterium silvaticum]